LPRETALLLTGRRADRLAASAERIAAPGRFVKTVVADLATGEGRLTCIERAKAARIDLMILNAGTAGFGKLIEKQPIVDRETLEVNIVSVVELLQELLPDMLARAREEAQPAGIIIVSSAAAFSPGAAGFCCYVASKSFLVRLVQGLAMELAEEPVDILALCPTYTDTEFFRRAGLPAPPYSMTAQAVALEGMAALGRRSVHLCGGRNLVIRLLLAVNPDFAQDFKLLFVTNPALAFWEWPRRLLAKPPS
jgi:uncharacterized protein